MRKDQNNVTLDKVHQRMFLPIEHQQAVLSACMNVQMRKVCAPERKSTPDLFN